MRRDYRRAGLAERELRMLDFAVKLTLEPGSVEQRDLGPLREVGFDDRAIHDIVQVSALFNYYNRLADGLGLEREPP